MISPEARRVGTALLAAVVLLVATPTMLAGQEPDEACDYDACALRVDPGGWFSGGPVVLRGTEGIEIAPRDRSSELERWFQRDDSAAARYAEFAASDRRADWLGRVSGVLMLAGLVIRTFDRADDHQEWSIGLLGGGVLVDLAAIFPRRDATRSFSRAVWWFNRSLPRSGGSR